MIGAHEEDVIWFLRESDGDACGLRATSWNHLAEIDESERARVAPSRAPSLQLRDPMPDHAEFDRRRMRTVYRAWCALAPADQAALEARYADRGKHTPVVPGLGEWTWVAQLLVSVRRMAETERRTPFEVLRSLTAKGAAPSVLASCRQLCAEALASYGAARLALDTERLADRARRSDMLAALRKGAA